MKAIRNCELGITELEMNKFAQDSVETGRRTIYNKHSETASATEAQLDR